MRYRSCALTRHRDGDDRSDLLCRFDRVSVGKVGVVRRRVSASQPVWIALLLLDGYANGMGDAEFDILDVIEGSRGDV